MEKRCGFKLQIPVKAVIVDSVIDCSFCIVLDNSPVIPRLAF